MSWIVIRSPPSLPFHHHRSIGLQFHFYVGSFFSALRMQACICESEERVMRTEWRRSASLPSLSLLSPRDAFRIPIPSGPRCHRASSLGPAFPLSVAVYLSLSVARRAVAALLTDQSESGGPAARERLMQLPVVSPSFPPSSSSSSSPHSSSSSLSCIANEGFANVGFALAPSLSRNAIYVHEGQTRLPRE